MASRDNQVSDSEKHFVEELMGQMMLLPEERDLVQGVLHAKRPDAGGPGGAAP